MYLALHNTHSPFEAPADFVAMYSTPIKKQNTVNAMVTFVDHTVANVTAALKRKSMWANTL